MECTNSLKIVQGFDLGNDETGNPMMKTGQKRGKSTSKMGQKRGRVINCFKQLDTDFFKFQTLYSHYKSYFSDDFVFSSNFGEEINKS